MYSSPPYSTTRDVAPSCWFVPIWNIFFKIQIPIHTIVPCYSTRMINQLVPVSCLLCIWIIIKWYSYIKGKLSNRRYNHMINLIHKTTYESPTSLFSNMINIYVWRYTYISLLILDWCIINCCLLFFNQYIYVK